MTKSRFIHYPIRPKKLTATFVKKEYEKLLLRLPDAETNNKPDSWIKLYKDWNALKSYIGSEYGRISYAFDKNMADKTLEAAKKYVQEKLSPVMDKPEYTLTKAFLDSRHREALAEKYGQQLIPIYKTALKPLDPRNTDLSIKANALSNKYSKLIGAAKVSVKGKKVTLEKAKSNLDSPIRSDRKAAYIAIRGWYITHHDELAEIYDQLVELRTKMGQNVGYKTYTPLAYENMGRIDYGETEVNEFRKNIKKYFVPLLKKLSQQQTEDLGLKIMRPWDTGYSPRFSLPQGIVPVSSQLNKAQKIFTRLHPILGKHFAFMRDNNLIDLENRPNKRAGAYCGDFSDEQKMVVLCNSRGDDDDIRTLTHEMGHAFQGWESMDIEAVDLHWGSYDLAEVYSMSMEYLCLPYIEEFFSKQDAAKYAMTCLISSLSVLCYICVVDEFQHWVYQHPKASPAERDNTWIVLSEKYLPNIDYSGIEKYRSTRWYAQSHIFNSPFYYIDYALATVGALQIANLAAQDHSKTIKKYLNLCKLGGTMSFLQAFEHAGLQSPFDESVLKNLAAHTKKTLGL